MMHEICFLVSEVSTDIYVFLVGYLFLPMLFAVRYIFCCRYLNLFGFEGLSLGIGMVNL